MGRKIWALASGEVYNSYFCASLNNHTIRGLCRFGWAAQITGAEGKFRASRNRLPIVNLLGQERFTPSSLAPLLSTSKYLPLLKADNLPYRLAEVESLPGCAHDALSVTTVRLLSSHGTGLEQICWYPRAGISYLSITEGVENFEPWSLTRSPAEGLNQLCFAVFSLSPFCFTWTSWSFLMNVRAMCSE